MADVMYCALCRYRGPELAAHIAEKHPLAHALEVIKKMDPPIDPGNEPSKPKPRTLEWVMDFVRRHPGATTGQGEADLLVAEIDRLREELANGPSEYDIRQALWLAYSHQELDRVKLAVDNWTGTDHPQLVELAKYLHNRWETFP